ncbi:MAG TPA: LacI family DNA-binding transcriptional regulator [Planctomycetota bacterium]|nr:LacI family DNA-binding transcriptional regulator [Planctomycetota bacterium]
MGVGLKEIAKAAGVSVHTVSDILNRGREGLYRPETRERVLEISRKLHYRPNRAAQSMRSRKNRIVGFLTIDLAGDGTVENPIIYPFLVGTSHHLTRQGYHVGLLELDEIETSNGAELPPVLQERFFDGLLIHYGLPQRYASKMDIPVVWWDSGVFEKHGCIYRDEAEIGRILTRSLIAMGHKRIAFLLGNPQTEYKEAGRPLHFSFMKRYEAYLAEMQANGLTAATVAGQDIASIAAQMKQVNATAIIVYTTGELSYLQIAAQMLNLRIPQDLSVAACDFEAHARIIGVKCGGMSYDRFDAGKKAAQMLYQMIENPAEKVPSITLLGEFHPRDTVLPPAK